MIEMIVFAFSPLNVAFTVLLLLMLLYWTVVIVGAIDIELFDVDLPDSGLEADADLDVDMDLDGDGDVGIDEVGGSVTNSILHFFYVGDVPVVILMSVLIISMWTFSMLGNYYLNPMRSWLVALPIFAANLVASLAVCKLVGVPLKRLYQMINKDYNAPGKIIGRICKVTTTTVTKSRMGQAEVSTNGAPVVLNVLSQDDHEFKRGDEGVVMAREKDKGIYLIAPVDLEG